MTENVKTWADCYGLWHASVPISGSPAKDARLARANIIAELTLREGPKFAPSKVHVTREHVINHGTVIYGEVGSHA